MRCAWNEMNPLKDIIILSTELYEIFDSVILKFASSPFQQLFCFIRIVSPNISLLLSDALSKYGVQVALSLSFFYRFHYFGVQLAKDIARR